MLKFLFKLLAVFATISAAVVAITYWKKTKEPEYIEIYSDEEDTF